jgi:carbon storage regulator CsrA
MLIITRRTGEVLDVTLEDGHRLEFVILGVKGNQVRVGVNARRTIIVDRHEISVRKRAEAREVSDVA